MELTRRGALCAMLAGPLAALPGCGSTPGFTGEIVGAAMSLGHRVRELSTVDVATIPAQTADVVIVGGGLAGLSAAWRLRRAGVEKLVVLEVEPRAGGTAASGQSEVCGYPWGAHYVPTPSPDNTALLEILREIGAIESIGSDGAPVFAEESLCREPEERVFQQGEWHEGLYPAAGADEAELAELKRFQDEVDRWVAWRDAAGKRAFTLPTAQCSRHAEVLALDRRSMAEWLDERGFHSTRLRWLIEYSCRDDYGANLAETSAWAGLFYFASRQATAGSESAPLLTWPEGLGRIANHLAADLGDGLKTGVAVLRVEPGTRDADVLAYSSKTEGLVRWSARHVVLAIPQFVVPYVVPSLPENRRAACKAFEYGSWLVANVHLRDRPRNVGFEPAWDNVFYESRSLGYVTATHQLGRDHGPTVWTYYLPVCDRSPREARDWLSHLTWEQAAKLVVTDLETAHPDVRQFVTRIDVMKWGHAMVRPRPGFLWGPEREQAAAPWNGLHFAGTDLSGIALCEEAIHHGVRAADEVVAERAAWKRTNPGAPAEARIRV